MKQIKVSRSYRFGDEFEKETSVFVHGDELWRLQKTYYTLHKGVSKYHHSSSMDFTKKEMKENFPALFKKVNKYLKKGAVQEKMLSYESPFYEEL